MVGHGRDTLRLGSAGILGGWSRKSASSRARTTSTLKSNNPTARVGNNPIINIIQLLLRGGSTQPKPYNIALYEGVWVPKPKFTNFKGTGFRV